MGQVSLAVGSPCRSRCSWFPALSRSLRSCRASPTCRRRRARCSRGLNAPKQGRTAIIAYHNGVLFTVPELPGEPAGLGLPGAHLGHLTNPAAPGRARAARRDADAGQRARLLLERRRTWCWPQLAARGAVVVPRRRHLRQLTRASYPDLLCAGVRGCLFAPWFVGDTWWSYNDDFRRTRRSRATGTSFASWDHLGLTGVIGHPFLLGDLLIFASDQSRTGVATYDVSDPANPVLLDVLTTGGPGGYWPELWGGDGKLYIVFPYQTERQRLPRRRRHRPHRPALRRRRPLPGDDGDVRAVPGRVRLHRRRTRSTCARSSRCSTSNGANTVRAERRRHRHRHQPVRAAARQPARHRRHRRRTRAWRSGRTRRRPTRAARRSATTSRAPGARNYPVGAPISLLIHETLETTTIVNGTTFIVRAARRQRRSPGASPSRSTTCSPSRPTSRSLANTTYEVVLPAGGIKDAAGNGMRRLLVHLLDRRAPSAATPPPAITAFDRVAPIRSAPGASATLSADGDRSRTAARSSTASTSATARRRPPWRRADGRAARVRRRAGHYRATVQVRDPSGAIAQPLDDRSPCSRRRSGPTPTQQLADRLRRRGSGACGPSTPTPTRSRRSTPTRSASSCEVPVCDDPRSLARSAAGRALGHLPRRRSRRACSTRHRRARRRRSPTGYGSAPLGVAASPDGHDRLRRRCRRRRRAAALSTRRRRADDGRARARCRGRARSRCRANGSARARHALPLAARPRRGVGRERRGA